MVNVICMKWGVKFDASYVNILRAMVKRNLSLPHRFVCFTDDARGLSQGIETLPLPELDLPAGGPERCWRKLTTFDRCLGDLQGPTLFLDLDIVVVGSLDCFFEVEGEFFISHDYRWYGKLPVTGNSSVYRFNVGEHPEVIDYFRKNHAQVRRQFRHEQAYLSAKMKEIGQLKYWPEHWCRSFKSHCVPRLPWRYFRPPTLPPQCRVLVFHGVPNPHEAIHFGYRSPRKLWLASPWLLDYWHA